MGLLPERGKKQPLTAITHLAHIAHPERREVLRKKEKDDLPIWVILELVEMAGSSRVRLPKPGRDDREKR